MRCHTIQRKPHKALSTPDGYKCAEGDTFLYIVCYMTVDPGQEFCDPGVDSREPAGTFHTPGHYPHSCERPVWLRDNQGATRVSLEHTHRANAQPKSGLLHAPTTFVRVLRKDCSSSSWDERLKPGSLISLTKHVHLHVRKSLAPSTWSKKLKLCAGVWQLKSSITGWNACLGIRWSTKIWGSVRL